MARSKDKKREANDRYAESAKGKAKRKAWEQQCKNSAKGKAMHAWRKLYRRAENRGGDCPSYKNVKVLMTRAEFLEWAVPEFEKALALDPNERWTIDRIDSGNYELGKIRVVPQSVNAREHPRNKRVYAPYGYSWCAKGKEYLPIEEFTKDKESYNGLSTYCRTCGNNMRTKKQVRSPHTKLSTVSELHTLDRLYLIGLETLDQLHLVELHCE